MRWVRRPVVFLSAVVLAASVTALSGTAGAAGSGSGAAGGVAQSAPSWCTRDVLRYAAGGYTFALVRHDADLLPWASAAKLTENGAVISPGQGLWQTAGPITFARSAFDTGACSVHAQAVMDDGPEPAIVGIRFRIGEEGNRPVITESETYVTHSGDYLLFSINGLVESDTARPDTRWEDPVPEAQRSSREELVALADQYFSLFQSGIDRTPFQANCDRWENGQRMTSGNCTVGIPGGTGNGQDNLFTHRRYPFVDVEAGIVVGYVMFGSSLDFHMFKVVDGQARLIQAVVTDSGHTSTGWEEQEQPPPSRS